MGRKNYGKKERGFAERCKIDWRKLSFLLPGRVKNMVTEELRKSIPH